MAWYARLIVLRMLRSQLLAATLVAVLLSPTLCTIGPSLAAEPQASFRGKIVYFGNRKRNRQLIETSNLDGTELSTVLELEQPLYYPGRVSPDGLQVTYCVNPSPAKRPQIWLLTPHGKTKKLLDDGGHVTGWSPDGKQIAFCWREGEKWESSVINVDTQQVTPISLPPTDVVEIWTPDGDAVTVIAGNVNNRFNREDGESYPRRSLYTVKLDGTAPTPLTSNPDGDFIWPCFSPEGHSLAYYQRLYRDGNPFEYCVVANRDGRNAREVVCFDELDAEKEIRPTGSPCWTPDGKSLLWRVTVRPKGSDDNGEYTIVIVAADGSGVRWLPLDGSRRTWGGIDCR